MKKSLSLITVLAAFSISTSQAELLVYEAFQYKTAGTDRASSSLFHNQPDGGDDIDAQGLSGAWQEQDSVSAGSDFFILTNSLSFGDLNTKGNQVRGDSNSNSDRFARPISASLSSGTNLWFSVLANKLQNNFSAAEGGLVIGNQAVNNPRILLDTGSTGLDGFGVAPTTSGNNWIAYAWDGAAQYVGSSSYGVATDGSQTTLLIGHLSFDTGSGGTDEYQLYRYTLNAGQIEGGSLVTIGNVIEVDIDQSALDTLSLTRQVNTAYDEIRIGTTLDDVLGMSAPGGLLFSIK